MERWQSGENPDGRLEEKREETWEPHNNLGHFGIWLTWRDAASSLHWPCKQAENLCDPDCKQTVQFISKGEGRKGRTACLPLVSQTSKENQLRSTHGRKNSRLQVSFHQRMPNYAHSVNSPAVTVAAGRRFGKSHLQLQKVHLRF